MLIICCCLAAMCACTNGVSQRTEIVLPQPVLAEGIPEENFEGNYDYLSFELEGETYFVANTVKDDVAGKELNLEKDPRNYISAIEAFSTNKYIVLFYYQTDFDYGSAHCAVLDKTTLTRVRLFQLNNFNFSKYVFYEGQVFWLNDGVIVCYNVVDGLKKWETRIPLKQFSEDAIAINLYTDKAQLYLKNKKIGSIDLESGKWSK